MLDAEYIEEIAAEIDALTRERDEINQRIDEWMNEAWAHGFSRTDIAHVIDRQKAAIRDAAPGQKELAL